MDEDKKNPEIVEINLIPVLTNTPLNLHLEFIHITRNKEQIKKLMKLAFEAPEKIRGKVVVKDKALLGAKIKELKFEK